MFPATGFVGIRTLTMKIMITWTHRTEAQCFVGTQVQVQELCENVLMCWIRNLVVWANVLGQMVPLEAICVPS